MKRRIEWLPSEERLINCAKNEANYSTRWIFPFDFICISYLLFQFTIAQSDISQKHISLSVWVSGRWGNLCILIMCRFTLFVYRVWQRKLFIFLMGKRSTNNWSQIDECGVIAANSVTWSTWGEVYDVKNGWWNLIKFYVRTLWWFVLKQNNVKFNFEFSVKSYQWTMNRILTVMPVFWVSKLF